MAVENTAFCGQPGVAQWTSCGRLKNLENSRQILLCCMPLWLYNFSTSENGYHSETTSGDLGETPGNLEEALGASERSVTRRQLRVSRRTLMTSGETLRTQRSSSRSAGRPGNRTSGRCPGPVVGRTGCGSPIAPAASSPGQSAGIPGSARRGPCISYMRGPRLCRVLSLPGDLVFAFARASSFAGSSLCPATVALCPSRSKRAG